MSVKSIKIGLLFLALLYLSIVLMWRFPGKGGDGEDALTVAELEKEKTSCQRLQTLVAAMYNDQTQQHPDSFDLRANTFEKEEFHLMKISEEGIEYT